MADSGIDAGPGDAPPALSPIQGIAIGHAHACAVRQDMSVTCIGDNSKGQATPPPGQFYGVVAGGDVTCGSKVDKSDITKNGMSVCWGDDTYGQASPPDGVFVQAIGARHACGSDRDGHVFCWGDNSLGQATAPSGVYSDLTAGHNHTCAIRRDGNDPNAATGTIVCWGDNLLGQSTPPSIQVYVNGVHSLSAGGDHTCATDQGNQVWCWGDHTGGQSTPPVGSFISLAVGPGHACASSFIDYNVVCWGDDWAGATPTPPSGAYANLFAGDYRTCAWANDSSGRPVLCWGATYEPWY
jgi:alpha-tubulin suppressor-like RCC1 family protein